MWLGTVFRDVNNIGMEADVTVSNRNYRIEQNKNIQTRIFLWEPNPNISMREPLNLLCIVNIFFIHFFLTVECSTKYYGSNCSTPCGQCTENDVCDNVTGMCPSGCKHNWNGTKCDGKKTILHEIGIVHLFYHC